MRRWWLQRLHNGDSASMAQQRKCLWKRFELRSLHIQYTGGIMMTLTITRQRGLSMVELLVALLISSFLILGITQVYIDNRRNYVFQQSQASNQENTRFAEYTLNAWLNKAGYRRTPDQPMDDAFPKVAASPDCNEFLKEAAITGLKSTTEAGLFIRYQPA